MKKVLKKVITVLMISVFALGMTSCQSENKSSSKSETNNLDEQKDSDTITVTDVADRTITIPKDIEKVVITFNIEEYLAVAGKEGVDKIVGYSHKYWEGRREDAWNTFTTAFPQLLDIPDVGYNEDISVEKIISLAPDVVIMSQAVNYDLMETELSRLADAGIQVAFVNYHKQTIDMHKKSTMLLGEIMGQEERAAEIADFYEKQMNLVTERIAALPEDTVKPKVYMEFSRGVGTYGNSWSNKMWGALIGTCGGVNIAADLADSNSVDVAPEQVIASNPDIVIFTASPQTDIDDNIVLGYGADEQKALSALEAYKNRDGWGSLNAVKNERMSALYHDLSRHIFDFAGTRFLAKQIYPELFEDINPEENLRDFFDKYMPVELDGVWTISLT